mmetsp:Transcript_102737/g.331273  ORF Transcript_102737/g.331273 Transcript_102737/m.331273 type:complete len:81 (+) Transcript_102737:660-902(+)
MMWTNVRQHGRFDERVANQKRRTATTNNAKLSRGVPRSPQRCSERRLGSGCDGFAFNAIQLTLLGLRHIESLYAGLSSVV